jgi:hypothetical protein
LVQTIIFIRTIKVFKCYFIMTRSAKPDLLCPVVGSKGKLLKLSFPE